VDGLNRLFDFFRHVFISEILWAKWVSEQLIIFCLLVCVSIHLVPCLTFKFHNLESKYSVTRSLISVIYYPHTRVSREQNIRLRICSRSK
jgi:hypothetical protein